jgi:hypothetical protein
LAAVAAARVVVVFVIVIVNVLLVIFTVAASAAEVAVIGVFPQHRFGAAAAYSSFDDCHCLERVQQVLLERADADGVWTVLSAFGAGRMRSLACHLDSVRFFQPLLTRIRRRHIVTYRYNVKLQYITLCIKITASSVLGKRGERNNG